MLRRGQQVCHWQASGGALGPASHPSHHTAPHPAAPPCTRPHRVQLHGQAGEGEAGNGAAQLGRQQAADVVHQVVHCRVGVVLQA